MKIAIATVLLSACHGWTARDTALELAAQATLAADYHQTQQCVDAAPRCGEYNPMIGDHGERLAPAAYFIGAGMLHAAIAAVLPRGWWRTSFQIATTGLEAIQVYRNVGQLDAVPGGVH